MDDGGVRRWQKMGYILNVERAFSLPRFSLSNFCFFFSNFIFDWKAKKPDPRKGGINFPNSLRGGRLAFTEADLYPIPAIRAPAIQPRINFAQLKLTWGG